MKLTTTLARVLALTIPLSGLVFAKNPAKTAEHDTKEAVVKSGKATGRGARETGKGIKKGSEDVGRGAELTAENVSHDTKKAGEETGKGIKRVTRGGKSTKTQ